MYYCSPVQGEQYYLRLLLTTVQGPASFEDLRTVHGELLPTFHAACVALGLLEDDREWIACFEEAVVFAAGRQLRTLFVTALLYSPVADPSALWTRFHDHICNNLPCVLSCCANLLSCKSNVYLNYGLFLVSRLLKTRASLLLQTSSYPSISLTRAVLRGISC